MLDRAFIVAPANPAFGGGALVDARGNVMGITSLRLGERPYTNLAIPVEKFLPGRDELLARAAWRAARPRPWLGLYTSRSKGAGWSWPACRPSGPAARRASAAAT